MVLECSKLDADEFSPNFPLHVRRKNTYGSRDYVETATRKMVRVILVRQDQSYRGLGLGIRLGIGIGLGLGLGLGLGPNFREPDHFSHRKIGPAGLNLPPEQNSRDRTSKAHSVLVMFR